MEQLKTIGRELAMGSQGGFGQSKEFLDLVKSIGEARSKAEEDRIVLHEIEILKRRISEPDIPKRKMKEYIIRLVYVEMLGHDASFGYIHAVKMTHDDNLLLKRTGYLAVTLFLNEDHDLIILIVNTIQKDLKSDNFLVVCAALNAVCKLDTKAYPLKIQSLSPPHAVHINDMHILQILQISAHKLVLLYTSNPEKIQISLGLTQKKFSPTTQRKFKFLWVQPRKNSVQQPRENSDQPNQRNYEEGYAEAEGIEKKANFPELRLFEV